jgi:hypothetical protein
MRAIRWCVMLVVEGGDELSVGVEHPGSPANHRRRITILPTADRGWWAVGLATAFFPLVFAASIVPRGAAVGVVSGLAGGVVALMAIIRDRERAVTVFAALVPLLIGVGFLLAQLITGSP